MTATTTLQDVYPPLGRITHATPVGFELIGVTKVAAIPLMGSRVWGRFNPNHWDPAFAAKTGLAAPIQTGEMSSAYIAEMCVNYFGKNFFVGSRINCKYINAVRADDVITTHGVVREKNALENEVRFVVDVWADDQHGEKKTVGVVEVSVPR